MMTTIRENDSFHELQRQNEITWQRGKSFSVYEPILGEYIVKSIEEYLRPHSLLDVACGDGLLTNMLARHFQRVVGLDASEVHLTKARERYPHITFIHGLAENYQDAEGFSTITLINLLEHVQDPVELLESMARNLADKGVLIAYVPNALAVNRRIAKLMGTLIDEYELSPFDINIAGHRRVYDLRMLIHHFEMAGLKTFATGGVFYKMLSQAQMNWFLENGLWESGGFGWGRVGAEHSQDWRKVFCDACYEFGKQRPEDCNIIYAVGQIM